jgi:hypothetical protein
MPAFITTVVRAHDEAEEQLKQRNNSCNLTPFPIIVATNRELGLAEEGSAGTVPGSSAGAEAAASPQCGP